MLLSFDEFELDEELYQLRRAGVAIPLEPKPFAVLRQLVRKRGQVVSRDALLDAVWPDEHVTESVLHRCVSLVRKALGDEQAKTLVATVRGRGYRFTAEVARSPAPERTAGRRVPVQEVFLGRDAVIAELAACWQDAEAGRGRIVLLIGEPGIGKTRIVDEFIGSIPGAALVGRCVEGDSAPPYWPWVQVVRAAIERRDDEGMRSLLDRLEGASEDRGDDRLRRFRLFDDLSRGLAALASRAPIAVVLEDLHWADAPTLLVLQNLAPAIADRRVLVVATLRDERRPRGDAFALTRGDLARLGHTRRIALEGLGRDEVARFLALTLGRAAPAPLLDAVMQRTEGNPLFLREVVDWILAQPQMQWADLVGRWDLVLPDGLRDVIERRIAALGEGVARVLEAAAVLGREFDASLLTDVRGGTRVEIDDALQTASDARVIERFAGARDAFTFSHALVRETLLEGLPRAARAALHVEAGEALSKRYAGDTDPVVSELAHHFFEACPLGDPERALHYVEAAADAATRRLAWEDAALQLERAATLLERADPPDPRHLLAVHRSLGNAWNAAGDIYRMRNAYVRAADLAHSLGDPVLYAEMVLGALGSQHWDQVPHAKGNEALEAAIAGLPNGPSSLRVRLLSRHAGHCSQWGEADRALEQSERALAMARTLDDPATLAVALTGRGSALHGRLCEPGGTEEYAAILDEVLSLTGEGGVAQTVFAEVGDLRQWRASLSLMYGDSDAYRRDLEGCIASAERSHHPAVAWLVQNLAASLALFDARLDDADQLLMEAFRTGQRFGLPWASQAFLAGALELARCRGQMDAVATQFDRFALNFPTPSELLFTLELSIHAEAGRAEQLRARFEAFVAAGIDRIPRHHEWIPAMCGLSEAAYHLRHTTAAAELYALLSPHADAHCVFWGQPIYQGPVELWLSRLALVLGRTAEAIGHGASAVDSVARMGAPAWEVRARRQYADALRAAGRQDDAERESQAALGLATELGLCEGPRLDGAPAR